MHIIKTKSNKKECKNMSKGSFMTGMITGAMVGVGMSMMINPFTEKERKKVAKQTSKLFTTIGTIADDLMDIVR